MLKKILLTTAFIAVLSSAAQARVDLDVGINLAPPEEQVEYMPPPPQQAMVWTPGYWAWAGNHYAWVPGRYVPERPGFIWVKDSWEPYGHGWRRAPGHWEHEHFVPHHEGRGHWGRY